MNDFYGWENDPETQPIENKIQEKIQYHEDKVRVGVLGAICVVVVTCVFLLVYC